ncbi:MAG: hypothetical protein EPN48_14330 [Microbacteriaceae bacterium]|nr:MAG: hypothetical protein EPN48_14330 [Microbacteriaceae bacterium]
MHDSVRDLSTPTDGAARSRVIDLLEFFAAVEMMHGQIDTELATASPLDQANAHLSNVVQYVANFAANPDQVANLDNVQGHLENVRVQLAALPRASGSPTSRASLTKAMNTLRADYEAVNADLSSRLADTVKAAAARESELEAKVTVSEARLSELEQRIDADEVKLRDALSNNNDAFIAAQTARDDAYRRWLDDQESKFSDVVSPYADKLRVLVTSAEGDREEIQKLRTTTVDLAELATGDILAGSYGEYAKVERRSAFIAYGAGALAVIAGVTVLWIAFGQVASGLPWQSVVLKLSITAGLGAVATVAFRYGGHATYRATSFKRQELELRALTPLLTDVEGADDAKVKFVKRSFGHAWSPNTVPTDTEAVDTLSKFTDTVRDVLKAAGNHAP